MDDGSFDNTIAVIEKNFSSIVRLIKQKKLGPATARNRGVATANTSVVVFTDADCQLDSRWLENMIDPIENGEAVGVQGRYKSRQKNLIARFVQYEIEERYKIFGKSTYIDFLSTYSAAYKKEIFLDVGGFDPKYKTSSGEDSDLSYRFHCTGYKLIFNDKAICYHFHPENLSDYLRVKFYRGFWRSLLYSNHKRKIVKDSYTPFSLKLQVAMFYLLPIFFIIWVVNSFYGYIFLLSWLVVFFFSMLSFVCFLLKKSVYIAVFSPLIIFLRAYVIASGLFIGSIKIFVIDKYGNK